MAITEHPEPEAPASEALVPEPQVSDRIWNVPNGLSLARLLLALLVGVLIEIGLYLPAMIIFIVAVSTDAVDGWWARRFNQITKLGRMLDPFVDKIIICGSFVFLLEQHESSGVNAWMVIVIIGREMFVSSLRGLLEKQGKDFSANFTGKAKMVLQCVAVTASLLSLSPLMKFTWMPLTRDLLLWLAVIVTAWSGIVYIIRGATLLKN